MWPQQLVDFRQSAQSRKLPHAAGAGCCKRVIEDAHLGQQGRLVRIDLLVRHFGVEAQISTSRFCRLIELLVGEMPQRRKDQQVSLRSDFNAGQMSYSCNSSLTLLLQIIARGVTINLHQQSTGCRNGCFRRISLKSQAAKTFKQYSILTGT
jgi:hypothetical protein